MKPIIYLRPFRWYSLTDYLALSRILSQSSVKEWMVNVKPLSVWSYWHWLMPEKHSYLYAITVLSRVEGFVYAYADSDLSKRLQLLKEDGLKIRKPVLELSFAKSYTSSLSGIMVPALRATSQLVAQKKYKTLIAYISPRNVRAVNLVESAGFTLLTKQKYTPSSSQKDNVYVFNACNLNGLKKNSS